MSDPKHPRTTAHLAASVLSSAVPQRYLTIEEMSALTTLSVSTLRRLVKKGAITTYQPGGSRHRMLFPPDAIEQVARAQQSASAEETDSAETKPQRGRRPKWLGAS